MQFNQGRVTRLNDNGARSYQLWIGDTLYTSTYTRHDLPDWLGGGARFFKGSTRSTDMEGFISGDKDK